MPVRTLGRPRLGHRRRDGGRPGAGGSGRSHCAGSRTTAIPHCLQGAGASGAGLDAGYDSFDLGVDVWDWLVQRSVASVQREPRPAVPQRWQLTEGVRPIGPSRP